MPQPLIQLKKVRVTYGEGKANEMTALHEIDLEIYEGEYIVFLGPSGCGKSTLLYTIAGLEIPSAGEVIVAEKNLMQITPEEKIEFYRTTIGMIFQAFYLVAHLSAADNIMLAGMFAGTQPDERRKKADMLMDRFGITTYKDRKPSNMSGGQQQRTAIARALMNNPHIILADEPVGNLDSKNALTVLDLLADIHQIEGKTVIQVTHNANDARYADRVFYMKDGRVEKVVKNVRPYRGANATQVETKDGTSEKGVGGELAKLAAAHPNLSETELRALLIMRTIFLPYSFDTEQLITKAIEKFVKKEIDLTELGHELDTKHGGAGLYAPKAESSAREIQRLFNEMQAMTESTVAPTMTAAGTEDAAKTENDPIAINLKAREAAEFILKGYKGKMTPEEKDFIVGAIADRFGGKLDMAGLRKRLAAKRKDGGVGIHDKTAEHFSNEIEIIISK